MRQGQHNKRSRNRGRRQQPNPSSRVLESNGPDVKVRGTASHIAEKYTTLGRDAQAAGDIVAAENFFQHAEHYSRIVAAAQAYMQQQQQQPSNGPRQANGDGSRADDEGDTMTANGGERYGRDHGNQDDRDDAEQDDEQSVARSSDGHDGSGERGEADGKDEQPAPARAKKSTRAPTTRRRRRSGSDNANGSGETTASADDAEESSRHDDNSEDQVPAAG